ncbi:MAG: hypothetical protein KAH46_27330, partial [Mycobacterium sp.]|nr:hypothetical protein [Mycobacterium sp.]
STVVGAISGRIASTTAVTSLAYGQAEGRGDTGSGDATSLRPVLLVGDGTGGVSRFDVDGGGALGPRIPVGSAAITSITSIGATSATGSADGTVHRIAGDGTAVRVADVYPDQGSGDVRVGALDDSVVAVGDEIAGRVIGLRTSTVAERICTRVGC